MKTCVTLQLVLFVTGHYRVIGIDLLSLYPIPEYCGSEHELVVPAWVGRQVLINSFEMRLTTTTAVYRQTSILHSNNVPMAKPKGLGQGDAIFRSWNSVPRSPSLPTLDSSPRT